MDGCRVQNKESYLNIQAFSRLKILPPQHPTSQPLLIGIFLLLVLIIVRSSTESSNFFEVCPGCDIKSFLALDGLRSSSYITKEAVMFLHPTTRSSSVLPEQNLKTLPRTRVSVMEF